MDVQFTKQPSHLEPTSKQVIHYQISYNFHYVGNSDEAEIVARTLTFTALF